MRSLITIAKRELMSYFRSPMACVFIVVFLLVSALTSFFLGELFENKQANLDSYFDFLPWIHLLFATALGVRLWSQEYQLGTVELLLTLPVKKSQAIVGNFLAAWTLLTLALLLSLPLALTIEYLGDPDWGSIVGGYLGGTLLGASFLATSATISALTKNQVIAFTSAFSFNFLLIILGTKVFTQLLATILPMEIVAIVTSLGVLEHFNNLTKGIIDTRDLVYFIILIIYSLYFTRITLDSKEAI